MKFWAITFLTFMTYLGTAPVEAMPQGMSEEVKVKKLSASKRLMIPNLEKLQKKERSSERRMVMDWCQNLRREMKKFGWKLDPCRLKNARVGGLSVKGKPLVYFDLGDPKAENTTLILSMIHSDEITPLYVGIKTIFWISKRIKAIPNTRLIIAPLVNPDGFYLDKPTRTNARGVDLNRNFHTSDFKENAIKIWKHRYGGIKRRFPGEEPHSEPETLFQRHLIFKFRPSKILSIHAPLNFMDYDGPNVLSLKRFPKEYVKECLKLRSKVDAVSGGFFVGSLGNYAGQERGIPTLTLELPSANPRLAEKYWDKFKTGVKGVIQFTVPDYQPDLGKEASSLVLKR